MLEIKKIITAINNPNLNNQLNLQNNIQVICKDLQYKDAIIDILNENKNVDVIIIYNEIPSEISDDELIKKIKELNEEIRIIYILDKLNKDIEEILNKNNIKEVYFNNEITINKLIKIINDENNNKNNYKDNTLDSNEEIKKELLELKKIIYANNNLNKNNYSKYNNLKNKNYDERNLNKINNKFLNNRNIINQIYNKIKQKINIKNFNKSENINTNKNNFNQNKIITISGPPNVGKTNFIINFYKIIKNKKILIIDFDLSKKDIKLFLGIKKYYKNNKKNNIENNVDLIFIIELLKYKFNYLENKFYKKNYFNDLDNFNFLEFKNFIQDFFNKEKETYDLILIDLGSENNSQINNLIFENSDINILLTEGNLIGINKLKLYLSKFNKINNLKIIINKKDLFSIDNIFLQKLFGFEILGEIKYKNFYSNLINNHFNFYYNFKNNYKKEYEKIYNKLNI